MISDLARTRAKGRKAVIALWARLEVQPFPYLHELAPQERDRFVLIDAYLRGCLEEWVTSGGQLSVCSTRLLADCARSITRRFHLLDGEGQSYFGQLRRLALRILRNVDVGQAEQEAASPNLCEDEACAYVAQQGENARLSDLPPDR